MFGRRGTKEPPKQLPQTEDKSLAPPNSASKSISDKSPNQEHNLPKSPVKIIAENSTNNSQANNSPKQETEKSAAESKKSKSDALLAANNEDSTNAKSSPDEANAVSAMAEMKESIYNKLIEQIDVSASSKLPREELKRQIIELIGEIVIEQKLPLTQNEQHDLATQIVDDMLGYGPLEPLLRDEAVTDIMVNGPYQIYVERKGKLELTNIKFRDNSHVMSIATRIVTAVGRRVDESSPICDARLPDGSRVNVIAQPCSIKGASISIRKFSQKKITLDVMVGTKNVSEALCKVLKIAGAVRLNLIISGGTGSGKTTLLNAVSRMISHGERVVTIEDAAELQLQQPHVVPLETRIANLEGEGEITMRDLVKNALRMRPDRIILGEVRGGEAFDLLQAMNTGHDGSMGTLHANTPREALARLENMIGMAGINLPSKAVRAQIASAVNMIVQIQRMRDGVRRVTHVTEVTGMEGDVIITQDLFTFEFTGEDASGKLTGEFKSTGIRPNFTQKAAYYGLDQALIEAMTTTAE